MNLTFDNNDVVSLQDEDNKIKEPIDKVVDTCIAAPHTQDSVATVNREHTPWLHKISKEERSAMLDADFAEQQFIADEHLLLRELDFHE